MTKLAITKVLAAALVVALGGCAIVPYGAPPVYVGVHGGYYGHGYYGGGYSRGRY